MNLRPIALCVASLPSLGTISAFLFAPVRSVPPHFGSAPLHVAKDSEMNTNMGSSDRDSTIYWNRETGKPSQCRGPIVKEARILALCDPDDVNNELLYAGPLPQGATLLKVGTSLEDFVEASIVDRHPNVIFVSHPAARVPLAQLLEKFPSVEWIHTRSAGIDFVASDALFQTEAALTNAKGMFSSTLAEYCMAACSYFAKDLPRLMRQKAEGRWEPYPVAELRGATLGVVGCGDIGRASARLARAYGMRVLGVRRRAPSVASRDPCCDEVFGREGLEEVAARSDYLLVCAPLTEQTRGMLSADVLARCRSSAVIINVGRGPLIDEGALIAALTRGALKGAALDVTTVEPLPEESPLWKLDNVLLSPHNMDMTTTFMKESTEFFVNENLSRFVRGERLLNPVDKSAGY